MKIVPNDLMSMLCCSGDETLDEWINWLHSVELMDVTEPRDLFI